MGMHRRARKTPWWGRMLWPLVLLGAPAMGADMPDTHIPLIDKGVATYYVRGNIAGVDHVDLLVDTGAGYSAINERTLNKLKKAGLAEHVRDIHATMANGTHTVVPIYRISRLNIGGHCEVHDIEVAVLPGNTRCILGLDTLKRLAPFMVSVDPPRLWVSNCARSLGQTAVGAVR